MLPRFRFNNLQNFTHHYKPVIQINRGDTKGSASRIHNDSLFYIQVKDQTGLKLAEQRNINH